MKKFNNTKLLKKIAMLSLAAMPVFTSCEKDETEPELPPVDTTEQQIAKLTREVRTAFVDAKTKPGDISRAFDIGFRAESYKLLNGMPQNIVDSCHVTPFAVNTFFEASPNSINTDNLIILKTKANQLIQLVQSNSR